MTDLQKENERLRREIERLEGLLATRGAHYARLAELEVEVERLRGIDKLASDLSDHAQRLEAERDDLAKKFVDATAREGHLEAERVAQNAARHAADEYIGKLEAERDRLKEQVERMTTWANGGSIE